MPRIIIRQARARDAPWIEETEASCFSPWQRASVRSLRRSIDSVHQHVAIAWQGPQCVGFIVLRLHKYRTRIYDLAVVSSARGLGVGRRLVRHAVLVARARGSYVLVLEADANDSSLLAWYSELGFGKANFLRDYYCTGRHAHRFQIDLGSPGSWGRPSFHAPRRAPRVRGAPHETTFRMAADSTR